MKEVDESPESMTAYLSSDLICVILNLVNLLIGTSNPILSTVASNNG